MADNITAVQKLQSDGAVIAKGMIDNMTAAGALATTAFNGALLAEVDVTWPTLDAVAHSPAPPAPPFVSGVYPTTQPISTATTAIVAPTFVDPPTFDATAPGYTAPALPSNVMPNAPSGTTPDFNVPPIPDAPVLSIPTAPTFAPVTIPIAPTVDIPAFTGVLAADFTTDPTEKFSYVEQPYQDAMLDSLKVKLMTDLVNGGYGIEPNDEVSLWSRARDRELRNTETAFAEVSRQAAARGFMLPPGALFAQLAAARQDGVEKGSTLSRDVALKRADLYVDNRKFTITQVKEVEQMLITYWGYMQERALNTAKAVVDLGIKVYDARLARANYQLDRFKAQASVYETILHAALAHLEEYKARVEGARLSVEVQRVQAEVYRTQVAGVEAMANLYRTQLEAVRARVDIERMKLDAFRATIEIYVAQVGAKVSEFNLFEAEVRGALAPLTAYRAQVDAYASRIEASKSVVQAKTAILAAQIEPEKLKVEKYRSDIAKYSAQIQESSAFLQADVALYEARTRAFVSQNELNLRYSSLGVEQSKAQADITLSASKNASDVILARGHQLIAAAQAYAAIQASLASAYGSVGASALATSSGLLGNIVNG